MVIDVRIVFLENIVLVGIKYYGNVEVFFLGIIFLGIYFKEYLEEGKDFSYNICCSFIYNKKK